jgi:hypothetical protein
MNESPGCIHVGVGVYMYVILQAHQFLCFCVPIHIEYMNSRGWVIGEIVHIWDR